MVVDLIAIGAHDPSGHAGVQWVSHLVGLRHPRARIHVFPAALTVQDDASFSIVQPLPSSWWRHLESEWLRLASHSIRFVYIGWLPDPAAAQRIAGWLSTVSDRDNSAAPIILLDPVMKATLQPNWGKNAPLNPLLERVHWLFPNAEEWQRIEPSAGSRLRDECRVWCTGRKHNGYCYDTLLLESKEVSRHSRPLATYDVHGSGCTLIALVLAELLSGVSAEALFEGVQQQLDSAWKESDQARFRTRIESALWAERRTN